MSPPSRPNSAGPMPQSTPSNSIDHHGSSHARPSSYSVRPQLAVQTRLRARSITSTSSSSASPALAQTIAGSSDGSSLISPSTSTLASTSTSSSSSSLTVTPALTRRLTDPGGLVPLRPIASRSRLSELPLNREDTDSGDDDDDDEGNSIYDDAMSEGVPGLHEHEGSSSTSDSEETPSTPANDAMSPFPAWNVVSPKEAQHAFIAPQIDDMDRYTPGRSKFDASTRRDLRRGKSFTSLIVQPVTPSPAVVERPDPIMEHMQEHDGSREEHYPPTPNDMEAGRHSFDGATEPAEAFRHSTKTLRDFVPQIATLAALFISSFAFIALLVLTLPGLFIPYSVADLPQLTVAMSAYRSSSWLAELHLFVVLTMIFLWKQCFSIPGSILTNILFGALYGTTIGTFWACIWTALGSTGAYGIALVVAPLVSAASLDCLPRSDNRLTFPRVCPFYQIEHYFAKPLSLTRRTLKVAPDSLGNEDPATALLSPGDLFTHLLLARFFPLLPYSVLNVISGVLRLPLPTFFVTLVLGSFPFNFATVSIGSVVALAASDSSTPLSNKIWSPEVLTKLIAVTLVSVLPVVFKKQLKEALSSPRISHLATQASAIPLILTYIGSIYKDAIVRRIFGSGALLHSSAMASSSGTANGHASRDWKRQQKAQDWRRKLSKPGYEGVSIMDPEASLENALEGGSWISLDE
ncbi:BQ2448_6168 [Microbotryum intermedium]|uniref:BQ2448_6168 protein n=1 Tax=Microbotryum intermedium TaxID=269621 RepID=A0A238FR98_9BASI|nr:BQ2448_6168 [Microbotryum intermedium]